MAYQVISQNNTTTTLADENGNIIRVPARVSLATSTDYTIKKVNNSTATLEDGNGNIIRDVPCVAVLVGGEGGGGGDQHNLGWYATESALTTAHPTATAGDWAIVGSTDTVWLWDTDNEEWVDSDQKGQVTSVNGQTGDVVLDLLPSQTGNAGKFLTTDGTDASWSDKPLVNEATGTNSIAIGSADSTNTSVTIGKEAVGHYGVTIGYQASGDFAIGRKAKCGTYSYIAIGNEADAGNTYGIAIGPKSKATGNSVIVIGNRTEATATGSLVIGNSSKSTANYAIQIGPSNTNNEANTLKIALSNTPTANYKLLDSDGTIPTARLTKVNSTITLTAAGWSSNTQTVSVTGMTADGVVMVSPDPTDQSAYTSAGIICSAQAAGTLTFTCSTTPTADLSVNVVML